jgi:hypothetical protein
MTDRPELRIRKTPRDQIKRADRIVAAAGAIEDLATASDLDFLNPKPIQSKKRDVLKILQISSATFDRLIGRGELRAHKIGKVWYVTHEELRRFIKSRKRGVDAIAHPQA